MWVSSQDPRSTLNSLYPIFFNGEGLIISLKKMIPHFVLTKNQIHERCKACSVNSRIYLDGGLVGSMEFVRVKAPYHDYSFLGRIVEIKEKRDIPKRELITKAKTHGRLRDNFVLLQRFDWAEPTMRRPDPIDYGNIPDTLVEVIETCKAEWVHSKHVVTLSFVFHQDEVQSAKVSPQGIHDAHCVRCTMNSRKTKNGHVCSNRNSILKSKDFDGFYNPHQGTIETHSHKIWCLVAVSNEEVSRFLGCGGKWDRRTKSVTIKGVGREAQHFLESKLSGIADPTQLNWNQRRFRKIMLPDLSVTNSPVRMKVSGYRFLHEADLEAFRSIFGCHFAIRPMIAAPTRKSMRNGGPSTRRLRRSDMVRLVSCSDQDYMFEVDPSKNNSRPCPVPSDFIDNQPKRQKIRCSYSGLDVLFFETETGTCWVTYTMRFIKVLASSPCVIKAQSGGVVTVRTSNDEEDEMVDLAVGDYLLYNDKLYTVKSCCKDDNTAEIIEESNPGAESSVLDYSVVNQLAMEFASS